MPKKVTLVSAGALILFTILIIVLINICPKSENASPFPEKVTVFLPQRAEIVSIDYTEFLEGCLRGFLPENGAVYEQQTLEALAAVVNTNALYTLKNHGNFENFGADFTINERFPYVDYTEKAVNANVRAAVSEAVDYSENMYFTHKNKPVLLEFCRISSGKTIDNPPLMPSKSLPSDVLCEGYLSKNAYTESEVLALSEIKHLRENPADWFSEPIYDEYGALESIKISNQPISGDFIRETLGLRSNAIEISHEGDCFIFTCRGWGNNAGMSLAAADAMSRDGKTAEEILAFFYGGTLENAHLPE